MVFQNNEEKKGSEIYSDAWERFERAVDAAVKSGPKHKLGKHKAKTSQKASLPKKRG